MPTILQAQTPVHAAVDIADNASDWLLTYEGKSTNQVRWDSRLPKLLNAGLPHIHADFYDPHKLLPENALVALSGPPQPVSIESHRYVVLAASVPHVGELKGMLWVDTGASSPSMIFAALDQNPANMKQASLALFTRNDELAAKLPPQFLTALHDWLTKTNVSQITRFTMQGATGKVTEPSRAVLGEFRGD